MAEGAKPRRDGVCSAAGLQEQCGGGQPSPTVDGRRCVSFCYSSDLSGGINFGVFDAPPCRVLPSGSQLGRPRCGGCMSGGCWPWASRMFACNQTLFVRFLIKPLNLQNLPRRFLLARRLLVCVCVCVWWSTRTGGSTGWQGFNQATADIASHRGYQPVRSSGARRASWIDPHVFPGIHTIFLR